MDSDALARRVTGTTMSDEASPQARFGASDVVDAIANLRVVPVVTIDAVGDGPNLASALVQGGLSVIEITLRTPGAMEALRAAASEVPDAVVGAGSVTSAAAAVAAIDAGARFIVSPGLDDDVVRTAQDLGVPVIPGIATATELMRAAALGLDVVKLFPAEAVGGTKLITALSAVWPDMRFMPTGGITPENAPDYLALGQVLAVGGSWMVPKQALAARDWNFITATAAASLELTQGLS